MIRGATFYDTTLRIFGIRYQEGDVFRAEGSEKKMILQNKKSKIGVKNNNRKGFDLCSVKGKVKFTKKGNKRSWGVFIYFNKVG